ncbi:MAG: GIY-YIG nuclease family protein [Thermoplasmatales archaeon]|nr:MAG: GIY-YIG nuclease family protein [Thermoplasmatales archaeon]
MRGSYLMLVELKNPKKIQIGNLRDIDFKKGFYIYVGSALSGLNQRIQRHLRKQKKIHWHIDYLLTHAKIVDIFYKQSTLKEECCIAKILEKELSIIPNFGCSDCTCKSHLFHGSYEDIKNAIANLEIKQYSINAKS